MSQIVYLVLSLYFIPKKRFCKKNSLSISTFAKMKTKTYTKVLRHSSLRLHLMNTCSKFDAIMSDR